MQIRVAITCSDMMIQTQFHWKILGKLPAQNTTLSDFMEDFWPPFFLTDFGGVTWQYDNMWTKSFKFMGNVYSIGGHALSMSAARGKGVEELANCIDEQY